ncbi:YebG family protein, partial [Escherichia coli]
MAVEVKYVVIREGEEKMSFTSKKEADAYDKMLCLLYTSPSPRDIS